MKESYVFAQCAISANKYSEEGHASTAAASSALDGVDG